MTRTLALRGWLALAVLGATLSAPVARGQESAFAPSFLRGPATPARADGLPAGMWLPRATGPGPSFKGTLVCDSKRGRLLAYGGESSGAVWALELDSSATWTAIAALGTPPAPRAGHAAVYDAVGDRMIILGGSPLGANSGSGSTSEAWSLSLSGVPVWTMLTPAGNGPLVIDSAPAVYDSLRDRILLYAGGTLYALGLDGAETWQAPAVAGLGPVATIGCSMVLDRGQDRLLLFGGSAAGTFVNDLWACSLSGAMAWSQLSPTGALPTPRENAAVAIDPVRRKLMLFGGDGDLVRGDLWSLALDGVPHWSNLGSPSPSPSARSGCASAYDPVLGRFVLSGGGLGEISGDFSYDASSEAWALTIGPTLAWSRADAGVPDHLGRSRSAAVWDPTRRRMLVMGGAGPSLPRYSDVLSLQWDAAVPWQRLATTGAQPAGRGSHAIVLDTARDRLVVFGGTIDGSVMLNDCWALSLTDSLHWDSLAVTGPLPTPRAAHTCVYDPDHDRVLLYGGFTATNADLGDLWQLDLATRTWSQPPVRGPGPGPRANHVAVWDPVAHAMLLMGGSDSSHICNDAWHLLPGDTLTWSLDPAGAVQPPGMSSHTIAYDAGHDEFLVAGGVTSDGLTTFPFWGYAPRRATAWRSYVQSSGSQPPPTTEHVAAYDPGGDRLLLFSGSGYGSTSAYATAGTWAWVRGGALDVPVDAGRAEFALGPSWPNPARDRMSIRFTLPVAGRARLAIYDVGGRRVRDLVDDALAAGTHDVAWDARAADGTRVPAGIYFYTLEVAGRRASRRLVVIP